MMTKKGLKFICLVFIAFLCMGIKITSFDAASVTTPSNVKATVYNATTVKITYNKILNVTGYKIYRSTSKNSGYRLIKTNVGSSSTSYSNTNLITGRAYYYKVRAYKVVRGKYYYSYYSSTRYIKLLPKTPVITVTTESYNSLRIKISSQTNISGYAIYRATSSRGTYSFVTRTSSTNIVNKYLTNNRTYYYKVRAYRIVNGSRVYGYYSSIKSAKPMVLTPKVITVPTESNVLLFFNKVPGATRYQVYRSTSRTGTYTRLISTSGFSYSDTVPTKDKYYYYKVRAYKVVGTKYYYSSFSEIKPVIINDYSYIIDFNNAINRYEQLNSSLYVNFDITIPIYNRNVTSKTEIIEKTIDLNNAINSLIYKLADYSDLNRLLNEVNSLNANNYSNYDTITTIADSLIMNKNILEQSYVDGKVADLRLAINSLNLKPANYSILNDLVSSLENLSSDDYANFSTITNIINSIDYSKKITEQSYVDNLVASLNEAYDNLILICVITFDTAGGSFIENLEVGEGETINSLLAPTKTGYDFTGWTLSGEPYDFNTKVSGDMTLTATWTLAIYNINYNEVGELTNTNPISYTINDSDINLVNLGNKTGYTFAGWYNGEQEVTMIDTSLASDVTLTAHWNANTYNVTFDSNGGITTDPITATYNSQYGTLPVVTKEKYEFGGWYTEEISENGSGIKIENSTIVDVAGNHTLYAHWIPRYRICYAYEPVEGGALDADYAGCQTKYAETGTKIDIDPSEIIVPTGFRLSTYGLTNNYVTADSELVIYISILRQNYVIVYEVDGNRNRFSGFRYEQQTSAYSSEPEKVGYTFAGWVDSDGSSHVFGPMPANMITVYASWTPKKYNLTFDSNGGSIIENQEVSYNSSYGDLPTPTRSDYQFGGWYTTEENDNGTGTKIEASSIFTSLENQTLYAKWIPSYQLCYAYESLNGPMEISNCETRYAEAGTSITITNSDVIRPEGYVLNRYGLSNQIVKQDCSLVIYVGFNRIVYRATYNVDGDISRFKTFKYGAQTSAYDTDPEKEGHTFNGWVDINGDPYTFGTMPIDGFTVYASWTANS